MNKNKYRLVENQEDLKIDSKDFIKLKENDFVFLIFEENGQEERMWVKIKQVLEEGEKFIGELANEPVFLKDIRQGDEVTFENRYIVNFSTKEEQERIIEEFKETGKLPLKDREINLENTKKVIEKLIELPEKFKDNVKLLYKIKRIDRLFFKQNLDEILNSHEKSKDRNKVVSRMLANDMIKIFLSVVFIVVLPQISENIEDEIDYGPVAKDYYLSIVELLEEVLDAYQDISSTSMTLLEEIRTFYNDDELYRVDSRDLPKLFGAFIEETAEDVRNLI